MYDWSKESTIRLIQHYQTYPILWDPRHSEFKDEAKRKEAWNAISGVMKSERGELERKMRSLIFQYNREKKRSTEKKFGDTTEPSKPVRLWYAMKSLSFLSNPSIPSTSMKTEQELRTIDPRDMKSQNSRRRITSRQGLRRDSSLIKRQDFSNNSKKILRRKHEDVVNESVQVMKTAQQKKQQPTARDEYQIFGEHIACKMRKLPTQYSKVTVEHYINNIIHEAELGQYNCPPTVKSSFGTNPTHGKSRSLKSASLASSAVTGSNNVKTIFGSAKESSLTSEDTDSTIGGTNIQITAAT